MKAFKFKVTDNNVLFATLLALITSLIACVENNFAIILMTTISHFKRRLNLIQIVESFISRQGRVKRLRSEPRWERFGFVQREQVPDGTTYRQAGLAIVLGVSWCCGNYCLLAFVLWCGYCSVSFQSFVLRHWCPQHQETTIVLDIATTTFKNCREITSRAGFAHVR